MTFDVDCRLTQRDLAAYRKLVSSRVKPAASGGDRRQSPVVGTFAAMAACGVLIVLLQPLASRWLKKTPRSWVLAAGSAVTGAGMGAAAFATHLPGFVLSVAIWTLGEIVMSPVASSIIADLAPAHLRGRYQGAFTLSFSLGMLVAPLSGAWLVRATNMQTLWGACVAVGAICALGHLRLAAPRQRRLAQLGSAISGLRD